MIDSVLLLLYVGVYATEGMTRDLGSVGCLMIDKGIDVESRLYDRIVLGVWEVSGDGESVEFEAFCGWNGSSVDDSLSFFARVLELEFSGFCIPSHSVISFSCNDAGSVSDILSLESEDFGGGDVINIDGSGRDSGDVSHLSDETTKFPCFGGVLWEE